MGRTAGHASCSSRPSRDEESRRHRLLRQSDIMSNDRGECPTAVSHRSAMAARQLSRIHTTETPADDAHRRAMFRRDLEEAGRYSIQRTGFTGHAACLRAVQKIAHRAQPPAQPSRRSIRSAERGQHEYWMAVATGQISQQRPDTD